MLQFSIIQRLLYLCRSDLYSVNDTLVVANVGDSRAVLATAASGEVRTTWVSQYGKVILGFYDRVPVI